jgi:putative Holliday junction resolvase
MGRIMCFDWGGKRTGIAVTDPLRIIATTLDTVPTPDLLAFVERYLQQETVSIFLVGEPRHLDDSATHSTVGADQFARSLTKRYPQIQVVRWDERYTSKLAQRAMVDMGMKKKQRQQKGQLDQLAATIMLQEYLQSLS